MRQAGNTRGARLPSKRKSVLKHLFCLLLLKATLCRYVHILAPLRGLTRWRFARSTLLQKFAICRMLPATLLYDKKPLSSLHGRHRIRYLNQEIVQKDNVSGPSICFLHVYWCSSSCNCKCSQSHKEKSPSRLYRDTAWYDLCHCFRRQFSWPKSPF